MIRPAREDRRPDGSERGTVLILGIGLVAVCAAVLLAVVDVAALHLRHRSAELSADGAARAAAQALDLSAYYTGSGAGRRLPLDARQARRRAAAYLAGADGARWRLEDLDFEGDRIVVTVAGTVRLPFTGSWARREVDVQGTASAELARPAGG